MVSKELSEAAVEVNEILKNTSPELVSKIPKKFIDFLKDIASKTYIFNYDVTKPLVEQSLKTKTKGLIALIYKDFLCDPKEKAEFNTYIYEVLENIEQEKRERYNTDNLFRNKTKNFSENKDREIHNLPVNISKENIFHRIILFFKRLFNKNKS